MNSSTHIHPSIVEAFNAEVPDAQARDLLLSAIRDAYSDPERQYHNLRHLHHLVSELESVRDAVSDWNLTMLAAAYHDIVYDTARQDNEEASASRAGSELQPFLHAGRLRKLQDIIIATKHHEAAADTDTNLFCDADLAILGGSHDVYDAYAAQIRDEYRRYPDELYVPGRAAVLRKLLEQPALYKSAVFHQRYETPPGKTSGRSCSRSKAVRIPDLQYLAAR